MAPPAQTATRPHAAKPSIRAPIAVPRITPAIPFSLTKSAVSKRQHNISSHNGSVSGASSDAIAARGAVDANGTTSRGEELQDLDTPLLSVPAAATEASEGQENGMKAAGTGENTPAGKSIQYGKTAESRA